MTISPAQQHIADFRNVEQFFESSEKDTYFMCALYVLLGSIAIIANMLNIIFYVGHPELRKTHVYLIAVDFGEMINGLSYILTGIGRGIAVIEGKYLTPISVHDCFFTTYWPIFLIIGTETTALLTILVSIERIVAVNFPHKYDIFFYEERKLVWIFVVAMLQIIFLGIAATSSFRDTTMFSDHHCAIISSTADFYSTFHFCFLVIAYGISFLSLFVVYNFQNKKMTSCMEIRGNRGPMIYMFFLMTGVDVIVILIPSILMLGTKWNFWNPNDITVGLATSTFGLLSIIHIIFNMIYDPSFRRQVLSCYNRVHNLTVVTSLTNKPV